MLADAHPRSPPPRPLITLTQGSFLYIHRSAFMKLLGSSCQLDVKGEVEFLDKEGFKINPNV